MAFAETFLVRPDRFPALGRGEPWGERTVTIDLPGGPYRFSGLHPSQEATVAGKMADFLPSHPQTTQVVPIGIFRIGESEFRSFDLKGWEYSLDFDCRRDAVRIAGLDFLGRLDWTPGLTACFWTPVRHGQRFLGAFENFFRVLSSYSILERGGVLVHSAGVVANGGAAVFVGVSGSGKTTVSRLSLDTGRQVLSDDMNILETAVGGSTVRQVPFAGELGRTSFEPGAYPLRLLCRLEKGRTNSIRKMGWAEAIATLMTCSPNVNTNRHCYDALVTILDSLVQSVPTCVLTFSKDGGVWDVLEAEL